MSSRPLFRRNKPDPAGSEHSGESEASSPGWPAGATAPTGTPSFSPGLASGPRSSGSISPLPKQVARAESLEDFHKLVRQHQADRIYLDVLEHLPDTGAGKPDSLSIVLSALRGQVCVLAILPVPKDENGGPPPIESAGSFLGVLRSRFLFLGYSTSPGLASARLVRELQALG